MRNLNKLVVGLDITQVILTGLLFITGGLGGYATFLMLTLLGRLIVNNINNLKNE